MITYDKEVRPRQHKTKGYFYFIDIKHPLADNRGFVWYHRHAASMKLGRWVKSNEDVHHIDHNKANNSERNLEVQEHKKHSALSGSKKNMLSRTFREAANGADKSH